MENSSNQELLFSQQSVRPQFMVGLNILLDVNSIDDSSKANANAKAKAKIYGWYENQFFIIGAPQVNGKPVQINNGDPLVARFMIDGTVYGFNTSLIRKILDPTELWLLIYPNIVETKSLRQHRRIQVHLPATIEPSNVDGLILDLSKGGAMLEISNHCPIGEQLHLSFTLPNNEEVQNMLVEVRGFQQNSHAFQVGISFDRSDKENLMKILQYINEVELNNTLEPGSVSGL